MGSKALSEEAMRPVLDKLRDHLIAKNVAADIANKLCDSVANKLEGKVNYKYFVKTLIDINNLKKKKKNYNRDFVIYIRFTKR